ncbi:MAG: hypothetical protein ACYSWT_13075 [Planctomycetota bacterium]|jgi:hypothetical protein
MAAISLLMVGGLVVLPLEQTLVWSLFYSTLFWLPARGVAAAIDRCREHYVELEAEEEAARPCYHIGMKIMPPF